MKSLYEILKEENLSLETLKANIGRFVFLSDDEVKKIFTDEEIDFDYKTFIVETCFNRINRLPNDIFMITISYLEQGKILKEHYQEKIESLTENELLNLLYKENCSAECVLEIMSTSVYKDSIKKEKETNGHYFQCAELLKEIYLNETDLTKLDEIGKTIDNIMKNIEAKTEAYEMVTNNYIAAIINNIENIKLENQIMNHAIEIIKKQIKLGEILTPKMLEFYIIYRAKDLKLEEYLKHVYITYQDGKNTAGYFSKEEKAIKLFYESFIKTYEKSYKKLKPNVIEISKEKDFSFLVNQALLQSISHELNHVIDFKRLNILKDKKQNNLYNQIIYSHILRIISDDKIYEENHDDFITENRADIFSFIDFSIQTNKIFKDTFDEINLKKISSINAERIIKMYTEKTGKGLKVISPIKKFAKFYKNNLEGMSEVKLEDQTSDAILANLLNGDDIPIDIIRKINDIAIGKKITTNLYLEIISIINEYNDTLKQEKAIKI